MGCSVGTSSETGHLGRVRDRQGYPGRFVPVLAELQPMVADLLRSVGPGDYVIAAQRSVGGLHQMLMRDVPSKPSSPQSILRAKYLEFPERRRPDSNRRSTLLRGPERDSDRPPAEGHHEDSTRRDSR
jgi:hypothetical protein